MAGWRRPRRLAVGFASTMQRSPNGPIGVENCGKGSCPMAEKMPVSAAGLTIEAIEVTAIRVPLPKTYRGSYYQMTTRSTVLSRLRSREGITGEAWVGDEEEGLAAIAAIIRDELAPRLIGEDAFRTERCWELARPATFNI